jgi:hypothetical protein
MLDRRRILRLQLSRLASDVNANVRRVNQRSRSGASWGLAAGAGALVVGWIQLGTLATVVVACATLGVLILVSQLYPIAFRRRTRRSDPGIALVAEAGVQGRGGVIRFFDDRLEWEAKHGERTVIGQSEVSEAQISPVPLIRSTRMTLLLRDGTQFAATVTAPIDQVEQALSSPRS